MTEGFETIVSIGIALGATEEATRKWRERGHVPHRWRLPILREALKRGLSISDDDFVLSTTSRSAA